MNCIHLAFYDFYFILSFHTTHILSNQLTYPPFPLSPF